MTAKIFCHVTNTDTCHFFLHRWTYILVLLFYPTFCTSIKCVFLATALSDPGLYRLLTFAFQISYPFSIACVFPKDQFKSEALWNVSLWWGVIGTSPNSQFGGLILHLQPVDMPCCGNRDPLPLWHRYTVYIIVHTESKRTKVAWTPRAFLGS